MNKIIISLLVALGMVGVAQSYDKDTYSTYVLSASSGQIFRGAGYIKAVQLSTTSERHTYGESWGTVYDSSTIRGINAPAAMTNDNIVMFPAFFTSTPTITNIDSMRIEFPEPGIFVSSGAYAYKNVTNSGSANKMIIYFKR